MAEFTITLEGGNLSEFDEVQDGSGDMTASSAAARVGSYGISYLINDTGALWGRVTFDNKTTLRTGFYFNPNSLTMGSGDTFDLGTDRYLNDWRLRFRYSGGNYQVCIEIMTDGAGWSASSWVTISNDWHWLEVYCQISSGPGNDDGFARLWIDPTSPFGSPDASVESVDNDTLDLDGVRVGAVGGLDATTSGTFYIDHVCGNDTGDEIGPPPGTVYYVDGTTGNDEWPGTQGQPWRTLIKAGATLLAGDTAYVIEDTYDGDVQITHSGQAGYPITLRAYPGDRPVIDYGIRGIRAGTDINHVVIDGFEITGLTWTQDDEGTAIVGVNARFCTIRNCWLHDNPGHGILAYGAEGWIVEDCRIEDNGFFGIFLSRSAAEVDPDYCVIQYCDTLRNGFNVQDDYGSGIFFNLSGSHCQVENNLSVGNAGNGILFGGTCDYNVIAKNVCHHNGWYGIWVSALVTDTTVESNIIKENDCQRNNGGICVTASASNDIYRNIIAYNDKQLDRIGGGLILWRGDDNRIWNNVIWGNTFTTSASGLQLGAWWDGGGEAVTDTTIINNIVGETTSNRSLECSLDGGSTLAREDHNDWYGTVSGFTPDAISIDYDPLLGRNFRLGAGSPCIGAGTEEVEFPDSSEDIGAFDADDTIIPLRRIATLKPSVGNDALILEGVGGSPTISVEHGTYGCLTAGRLRSLVWTQFREPYIFLRVDAAGLVIVRRGDTLPPEWA